MPFPSSVPETSPPSPPPPPPALNLPASILWLCGLLVACFLFADSLSSLEYRRILENFALFPDRYFNARHWGASALWSPLTYSLLHSGWEHLLFNLAWLLIFGSVVARCMGGRRFFAFYFFCALGAAVVYTLSSPASALPAIGASGAVFGMLGAATRFMFAGGGFLGSRPRPLEKILRDRRILTMLAVILGIDLLFALVNGILGNAVAWQAHLGGFGTGLLFFGWFAPPLRSASGGPGRRDYGEWR